MATFVLEIGSEELPARFLAGEEAELAARFTASPPRPWKALPAPTA